jgi:hypothetical protein
MRGISFDGTKIPQLKKNNFGASFGRAIRKDKTFFYAVDEGLQKNLGFTANDWVPAAGCHGAAGAVITEAACPHSVSSGRLCDNRQCQHWSTSVPISESKQQHQ